MAVSMPSRAAALMALGLVLTPLPAMAQAYDPYNLEERLQRIEEQLRDLEDQVTQGGGGSDAGGAGPSVQRLNDLEESIRTLTGQVEQLGHDVRTVQEKLDRLETETNFRLNQLEGNPNGPATGPATEPGTAGEGGAGTGGPEDGGSVSGGSEAGGAGGPKPPGTIGDIPAPEAGSSAEETYNAAMDFLTRAEYDDALRLFREVVENYPDTDYAAQAQYWIADIHYVRKDYEKAALAFADVLKKYPQAGRGPEAMLKLGLSLINLDKKPEGCKTLGAIKQKYPKASDAILSRAEREAKKAGCS